MRSAGPWSGTASLDLEFSNRVTAIELAWTVVALFGLGVCLWSLIDSLVDRLALERLGTNGAGMVVVWINIRAAIAGIVLHVFFMALGVFALLTLNSRQTLTGSLFGVGFILVAAVNAGTIARNQVARIRLRRYLLDHPLARRQTDGAPH